MSKSSAITNAILQSIDIVTEQKLRELKLDRTVQATIISKFNSASTADTSAYIVEFQDSNITNSVVFSNRTDIDYEIGSSVYVTIPQNDRNLQAWIIGVVSNTSTDENVIIWDDSDKYIKLTDALDIGDLNSTYAQGFYNGGANAIVIDVAATGYNTASKLTITATLTDGVQQSYTITYDDVEGLLTDINDVIPMGHAFELPKDSKIASISIISSADNQLVAKCAYIAISGDEYASEIKLVVTNSQTAENRETGDPSASVAKLSAQLIFNGINLSASNKSKDIAYQWYMEDATSGWKILDNATNANYTVILKQLYKKTTKFKCAAIYGDTTYEATGEVTAAALPDYHIAFAQSGAKLTLTVCYDADKYDYWQNGEMYGNEWKFQWYKNDRAITSATNYYYNPEYHSIGEDIIYSCRVSRTDPYTGSDTVTIGVLTYTLSALGVLTPTAYEHLTITNGNTLFVWNEANVCQNSNIILSIKAFDKEGAYLGDTTDTDTDQAEWRQSPAAAAIQWYVPIANPMISIVDGHLSKTENGYNIYTGNTLTVAGGDEFIDVVSTISNQIYAIVPVNPGIFINDTLVIYTNFAYTVQGQPGTNGSRYIVKPVINGQVVEYGFLYYLGTSFDLYWKVWDVELGQWLDDAAYTIESEKWLYNIDNRVIQKANNTDHGIQNRYSLIQFNNITENNAQNIVCVTIAINGGKFYGYLPIVIGVGQNSSKDVFEQNVLNAPFFSVIYDSTGTTPFYRTKNRDLGYVKNNITVNISTKARYLYKSSVTNIQVMPGAFDKDCANEIIICNWGRMYFYIPIVMIMATSLYDFVGSWDGSSAEVGDDYIISPIAAFGAKTTDNKFTGLVLGSIADHTNTEDVTVSNGLFGYHENERTIELNAETGTAKFGKANGGQIIIDPNDDTAIIRSNERYNQLTQILRQLFMPVDWPLTPIGGGGPQEYTYYIKFSSKINYLFEILSTDATVTIAFLNEYEAIQDKRKIKLNLSVGTYHSYDKLIQDKEYIISAITTNPYTNFIIADSENIKIIEQGMVLNLTNGSIVSGDNAFVVGADGTLNCTDIIIKGDIMKSPYLEIGNNNFIINNNTLTFGKLNTNKIQLEAISKQNIQTTENIQIMFAVDYNCFHPFAGSDVGTLILKKIIMRVDYRDREASSISVKVSNGLCNLQHLHLNTQASSSIANEIILSNHENTYIDLTQEIEIEPLISGELNLEIEGLFTFTKQNLEPVSQYIKNYIDFSSTLYTEAENIYYANYYSDIIQFLSGEGLSNILSLTGNLIPSITDTYVLGASDREWDNVYTKAITVDGENIATLIDELKTLRDELTTLRNQLQGGNS